MAWSREQGLQGPASGAGLPGGPVPAMSLFFLWPYISVSTSVKWR